MKPLSITTNAITISRQRLLALALISLTLYACQKESPYINKETVLSGASISARNNSSDGKKDLQILFVTNRDGNDEIYAMNIDGSGQAR